MKKILLGFSVFLIALVSAQNYPDYYPNGNNTSNYGNGNYYGDVDDEFYFPDDYYYEYPSDYYSNDLYRNYYNDYRKSIYDVNWNRFFATQRVSPWQMQQIIMLNDSFPSYSAWNSYYRYNPDRWYYDRFYALQRILGPNVFMVFQNNFYNGYNPIVYYQNYNRRHYARNIYVIPRYRRVNVNAYRVNKVQYHQTNPRANIGFQQTSRTGQTANSGNTRDNGFRNDGLNTGDRSRNNSITKDTENQRNNTIRNESENTRSNSIRTESPTRPNSGGFRNDTGKKQESMRSVEPTPRIERAPTNRSNQNSESRTPSSSSRNSGNRFTTR